MKTEVKSLNIVSLLKFTGTIGTINGLFLGLPVFLIFMAAGSTVDYGQSVAQFGLSLYIGVVIGCAVTGAIGGLITGLVYNIVSGLSGGIEVDLENKTSSEPDTTHEQSSKFDLK